MAINHMPHCIAINVVVNNTKSNSFFFTSEVYTDEYVYSPKSLNLTEEVVTNNFWEIGTDPDIEIVRKVFNWVQSNLSFEFISSIFPEVNNATDYITVELGICPIKTALALEGFIFHEVFSIPAQKKEVKIPESSNENDQCVYLMQIRGVIFKNGAFTRADPHYLNGVDLPKHNDGLATTKDLNKVKKFSSLNTVSLYAHQLFLLFSRNQGPRNDNAYEILDNRPAGIIEITTHQMDPPAGMINGPIRHMVIGYQENEGGAPASITLLSNNY